MRTSQVLAAFWAFGGMVSASVATPTYIRDGATLTVTVPADAGEASFDAAYLDLLTQNQVTDFVKDGPGVLVMDQDILSYTGELHVNAGVYRFTQADAAKNALGVGRLTAAAGAITVKSGATLEAKTTADFNLGTKRISVGGTGVDGRGALLFNGTANASGVTWGSNLTLTDDALLNGLTGRLYYLNGSPTNLDLAMNGHTLTFNQEQDLYMVVLSALRVNATAPGDMVVSNKTILSFQGGNSLAEDPSCRLIVRDAASLNSNGWRGRYPYALEWDSTGSIRCPTYSAVAQIPETNRFSWHGPVELKKDLLYLGASGIAHLMGPVSGVGGLAVENSSSGATMTLNLWNAHNAFAGGVVGREGNRVIVHANGALPADGGELILTNGVFAVEDAENATYALPKATFVAASGRESIVSNGVGRWKSLAKTGSGELKYESLLGANRLDLRAGRMTLGRTAIPANRYAGLVYGLKNTAKYDKDDPNCSYNVFWTTECFTNSVELSPHMAYQSGAAWQVSYPVFTYRGYIWNRTNAPVTWRFASIINNFSSLFINGQKVIEQKDTRIVGFGNAVLDPGPNEFEYRMVANKDGASDWGGPSYAYVENATNKDSDKNWGANSGLMYNPQGGDSVEYTDFQRLIDPGDGSLFTWDVPATSATAIVRHPITGETFDPVLPVFDEMTFGAGAVLDAGNILELAPTTVNGFPTLENCPKLTLPGTWNLTVGDVADGGRLTTDGTLQLGETLRLTISATPKKRLRSGASYTLATAGRIEGDLNRVSVAAPRECRLVLSADGKSLLLEPVRQGLLMTVR